MDRRDFIKATSAGLAGTALFPDGLLAAAETRQPNIVLIMADDLGYECIGANGGTSYGTPVLDGLANGGARFEHCYAQPLCTPSRVQIMTGIYNVRNYVKFGVLARDETTFAHLLKEAGYATCIAGKWQLGRESDSPRHFGFDASCLWQHSRGRADEDKLDTRYPNPRMDVNGEPVSYGGGEYGPDVATDFICDFIGRNAERPFLVYYPMILTHCPFDPTPDSPDWDPSSKGSRKYKGDPRYFGDMVAYTDKVVGKIVARLEELGLRENTLVLFTGDNGTDKPVVSKMDGREVAGLKGSTTDAGTRVPLVASWPGTIPAGQVCGDLVDFSDFLPTLCEAADVDVPASLSIDGTSFLPQLRGETGNPREWIYCWYSRSGNETKAKVFARNQRYKLYATGDFHDVRADVLEQMPLQDGDLSEDARRTRGMLQRVLDRYRDARPPRLRIAPGDST